MKTYILQWFSNEQKWYNVREFKSYDDLLGFLARNDQSSCLEDKNRDAFWQRHRFSRNAYSYLDYINMNGNDKFVYYKYFDDYTKDSKISYKRQFMFMDEQNRVLDVRKDIPKIKKLRREWLNEPHSFRTYPEFEFRRGPVPGTESRIDGHDYFEFGHYRPWGYRHPKYGHLVKLWNSPEYKEYGRAGAIEHDPWAMCEKVMSREHSKSWKDNRKCKKQWMKNLK